MYRSVYMGTIDEGTTMVAVKRFDKNSDGGMVSRFQNEVLFLCQLHHPNLVSLIGFCDEQEEMILVYEDASRESLSYYLDRENCDPLSWKHRLKICIGAAQGLHYLHAGSKYAVFHRDISASTIILDEDWSCKLSHFGISKMGPNSMSKASIVKQELQIFMATDHLKNVELTDKLDVCSFGMLLLDVLCEKGVRAFSVSELANRETIYGLIDPYLKGRIAPECLEKYLEIACSCIEDEENKRPAMGEVEVMLELALELQNNADLQMEGSSSRYE